MTSAQLDSFRQQLFNLGLRINMDLSDLENESFRKIGGAASGKLSNTPLHPADLATDTFDQEASLTLLENEGRLAEQIRAALSRIDQGTFGKCERCAKEIGVERLRAVPYTALCITCAQQETPPLVPGNL